MTKIDPLVAKTTTILIPPSDAVGHAFSYYSTWRTKQGPKGFWSAHTRMEEASNFGDLEGPLQTFLTALRTIVPKHWPIQNYGFSLERTGQRVRFCGNNGKAQGGISFPADADSFAYFSGFVVGAIIGAKKIVPEDKALLKALDLTGDLDYTLVNRSMSNSMGTYKGKHMREARARAIVEGHLNAFAVHKATKTTSAINMKTGMEDGFNQTVTSLPWSLGPTLYPMIFSDKIMAKLLGKQPKVNGFYPVWKESMGSWDKLAAATILLLRQSKTGTPQTYAIGHGGSLDKFSGFCPASAMAHKLGAALIKGSTNLFPPSEWMVWPVAADMAPALRDIVQPLTPARDTKVPMSMDRTVSNRPF